MVLMAQSKYVEVRYASQAQLYGRFLPQYLLVDRYVTLGWYAVGLVGNIISYHVWTSPHVRKRCSMALFLAALALSDLVFLLVQFVDELGRVWDVEVRDVRALCESYHILYNMFQCLSVLLVLALAIDMCACSCKPLTAMHEPHRSAARNGTFIMIGLAFAVNVVNAYFRSYDYETKQCSKDETIDNAVHNAYEWATKLVFFALFPIVSFLLVLAVMRTMKSTHYKASRCHLPQLRGSGIDIDNLRYHPSKIGLGVLVAMVTLSAFLILPSTVMFCLRTLAPKGNAVFSDEEVESDETWQRYFLFKSIETITNEVALASYALRVLIYLFNKRFRRCAKAVLRRVTCKPRKAVYDCGGRLHQHDNRHQLGLNTDANQADVDVDMDVDMDVDAWRYDGEPTASFSNYAPHSVNDIIASYV